MSDVLEEVDGFLVEIEKHLQARDPKKESVLVRVITACETLNASWSGSWLGYQSRVYYRGFSRPPVGAHFSSDWGFETLGGIGLPECTVGDWVEYSNEEIAAEISRRAKLDDLSGPTQTYRSGMEIFERIKSEFEVLLQVDYSSLGDSYFKTLLDSVESIETSSEEQLMRAMTPKNHSSRDRKAIDGGICCPPHKVMQARCLHLSGDEIVLSSLKEVLKKYFSYKKRSILRQKESSMVGTHVFIGHGRSPVWRDLKDYVRDRVGLPWDEFNRVPVAGITNIHRLGEMLNSAAVAFIVMTAEDEQADGKYEARTNVIHEVGLFQGRLGFNKAIVLLEEGCEEFSNIQGLGQIRFPKGNISAKFDEIRQVLEREGLLAATSP